ncbi:MAG TPA: hypothetical protein VNJ12_12260 [Candidatus Dormibacteraeota bacterium]|nr:hypothetical protein [Candidatus Dormibacteraeota bacterium]
MKRTVILLGIFLAVWFAAPPVRAQNRPLQTPDADIVPTGILRVQGGFDFLQNMDYPLSGLSGDLTSYGVLNMRMGVGRRVEVQLQGTVQNFLQVNGQVPAPVTPVLTGANSTHDVGDFSLWTKLLLRREHRAPAVAFRFGFLMPNTNQARGLGNNATNVYASLILQKHIGRLKAFGDSGIGILQSPNAKFSQNDELLYGGALVYPLTSRVSVMGEVSGRYSSRKLTPALYGTESRGEGRMGLVVSGGGFEWDVAAIAGVYPNDPSTGFTFGVSRDLRLFGRQRP